MRFFSLFLFLNLLLGNASFAGSPKTLILNLSDWHAHYGNLPLLIRTISKLSQDFLAENPESDVVLVVNGDFVGFQGGWTQFVKPDFATDYGRLGYEVLALLAHYAHIVMVPGNHDEFDWARDDKVPGGYGLGLERYKSHHKEFAIAIEAIQKRPFRMTVSNIEPGLDGLDLFEPYTDIPLKSGKTLRFVGGILEDFFTKSNYDRWDRVGPTPKNYLDIIREVGPLLPAVVSQFERAAKDGLEGVVVAIHDENTSLVTVAQGVNRAVHLKNFKNPLWIGGHNHVPEVVWDNGRHFIQGGSHGDLTRIVLGDDFQVEAIENFPLAKQTALLASRAQSPEGSTQKFGLMIKVGEQTELEVPGGSGVKLHYSGRGDRSLPVDPVEHFELETSEFSLEGLRSYELIAMQKTLAEVDRIRIGRPDKILGLTKGFQVTKSLMRAGRTELGTLIAEALIQHGMTVEPPIGLGIIVLGDVGMFNSSSFRKDDATPPGLLTATTLSEWAPFADKPVKVLFLSGTDLEALFFSLRTYFSSQKNNRGLYSPQINGAVREISLHGTVTARAIGDRLQIKNLQGKWMDVNRTGMYRLTVDPWLAENEYGIDVWDEILKRSEPLTSLVPIQPTMKSVLEKNAHLFGCASLIQKAMEWSPSDLPSNPSSQEP